MGSLISCIESLLKFNNVLDCLILYPNNLSGDEETHAINLQKILNRNSQTIEKEIHYKLKNFKKYSKEEKAILLVFYGEITFSDSFDLNNWNNLLDENLFNINIDKLKKDFLEILN